MNSPATRTLSRIAAAIGDKVADDRRYRGVGSHEATAKRKNAVTRAERRLGKALTREAQEE